jgi:hypothetical protein
MPNGEVPPIGSRQSRIRPPPPHQSCNPEPTHTPSRAALPAASCVLPSFFQRELPLLTWPHLAQRPLRSAGSAGNSIFSSTLGISIAALQPCSSMCGVSSKNVCGLHQVRFLRMLIPVRPHADSAWQAKLFRCASFMQAQLCLQSMSRAIRPVLSLMVLNIQHLSCRFLLLRACTSCSETQMPYPTFHIPIPIPLPN